MADELHFIITPKLEARYWAKVDVRGPDECWPWLAGTNELGYGTFSVLNKSRLATHVALQLDGRPRPADLIALHSCDNPPCQNPAHLRWGTNADNLADCIGRGRHVAPAGDRHWARTDPSKTKRGESHGMAKLTESDIIAIRESRGSGVDLARQYRVQAAAISKIRLRKLWKHVA